MATYNFVELPQMEEARALADYTGIHFDLRSSRKFATFLLEKESEWNFPLSDPLMVATIIRYARSFAEGVRGRLNPEEPGVLTPEQRQKHEYFMAVRNKYIAHSVNGFEESQPNARYCEERVNEEGITSIECSHHRIVGLSHQNLIDVVELTTAWLGFVDERLKQEKASLLTIIRAMPVEEVLRGGKGPPALHTARPDTPRRRAPGGAGRRRRGGNG